MNFLSDSKSGAGSSDFRNSFKSTTKNSLGFGFGIEGEFLLVRNDSFEPLWFEDLKHEQLLSLVESIDLSTVSHAGFNQKPLHNDAGHYLIEGYTLTDEKFNARGMLPKGIEIRTPLVSSIDESVNYLQSLHSILVTRLQADNMTTAILSHHPTKSEFDAPPNYDRHDYWQWALTATATYGPDFNISLPPEFSSKIDLQNLNRRINFYMPSVIALSLASPLLHGDLWRVKGQIGKSVRTYRRSLWAPCFYVHEKPTLRFEFKGFEMSRNLDDYHAYFLVCLALLLDENLTGQASDQTRVYDLGNIAVNGLDIDFVHERAACVLESAEKIAVKFGFDKRGLNALWTRLYSKRLPADDIIERFLETNSIAETLRSLHGFVQNPNENVLPPGATQSFSNKKASVNAV